MKTIEGSAFRNHLSEVIAIDRATLPPEYVTSLEKLTERFETFEDSFVGVLDSDDHLAGYINFFPLQEPTRDLLVRGELPNDINMGKNDIHNRFPDSPFYAYIITVAVLPEHQNGPVIRALLKEFLVRMRAWAESSPSFQGLYASAVSDDGRRFLTRLGMRPLPQNPGLYFASITSFFNSFDHAF